MPQTEFEFTLPLGYVDKEGNLHREGVMRLATAADKIMPLRDARVRGRQTLLPIILLSRVITKLGSIAKVNPKVIEGLYAADLAYLQEFYNQINRNGKFSIDTVSPTCSHAFEVDLDGRGE